MKWMKKLSLKGNNRGASLIAVLVAMIFVSVIGAIVMSLTITNIRMKEMEQAGKMNFYSAEEVMDELAARLDDQAAVAMQKAYASMLEDYTKLSTKTEDEIQALYSRRYLDALSDIYWDRDHTHRNVRRIKLDEKLASAEDLADPKQADRQLYLFVAGSYKVSKLKECLPANSDYIQINDGITIGEGNNAQYSEGRDKALFTCDYINGRFTLQNIRVVYTDEQGYQSIITTDVVFNTPKLNFNGSNFDKEYMGYSVVADTAIDISAANVQINGNIYAGNGGIYTSGGDWSSTASNINGDMIVTRGDIVVNGGQNLVVGATNNKSQIWAENIRTEGTSHMDIYGNAYIADDLTLNGKQSTVNVHGNYYGYNFQENYGSVDINKKNAAYSSSIVVNAQNARLNLTDTKYMLLAGRTFISRGVRANESNKQDIMLGESASVRTNQLAYAVTENYLEITKEGDTLAKVELTDAGASDLSAKFGVPNIRTYLDSANPITTYYYIDTATMGSEAVPPTPRFYLNFESPQKANDFFYDCYQKNSATINANAHDYAGDMAIIMNDNADKLFTLAGDIMYKNPSDAASDPYRVTKITLDGKWEEDGAVFDAASEYAVKYKSLQMYLEESHAGLKPDNVRFATEDKSDHSVFESIIDKDAIGTFLDSKDSNDVHEGVFVEESAIAGESNSLKKVIVVANNEGKTAYQLPTTYVQGIVVANGDVVVQGNFQGCIIAKGKVSFTANAQLTANRLLVANMLEQQRNSADAMNLTALFKDYGNLESDVIGSVALDHYMTFDNWVKSGE